MVLKTNSVGCEYSLWSVFFTSSMLALGTALRQSLVNRGAQSGGYVFSFATISAFRRALKLGSRGLPADGEN
jgi:hypothetical protein